MPTTTRILLFSITDWTIEGSAAAVKNVSLRGGAPPLHATPEMNSFLGTVATGKVPQGRQDPLARTRGSQERFLSSLRDSVCLGRLPSDESLGYFRSSLRDFSRRIPLFLIPARLATRSIYSIENGEEPNLRTNCDIKIDARYPFNATMIWREAKSRRPNV